MAKKRFLVVKDSFIGMNLIKADMPVSKRIVEIETDPEKGGMRPGSNLVECDEQGHPLVGAGAAGKPKRTPKGGKDAATDPGASNTGGDGNANDLA